MMSQRDVYIQKMKDQLDEWNTEIGHLEKKMHAASADAKAKYQERLNKARQMQKEAEKKLEELRTASEGAWEELKGEMEHTWKAFQDSVSYFKSHFK